MSLFTCIYSEGKNLSKWLNLGGEGLKKNVNSFARVNVRGEGEGSIVVFKTFLHYEIHSYNNRQILLFNIDG